MKSRYETRRELEDVKKTRFESKLQDLDINMVSSIIKTLFFFQTLLKVALKVEDEKNSKLENLDEAVPCNAETYDNSDIKCVRFDETKREKEISIEKDTDKDIINKPESKVKAKLKQIKQQTEQEMAKLTLKKYNPLQHFENQKERAR